MPEFRRLTADRRVWFAGSKGPSRILKAGCIVMRMKNGHTPGGAEYNVLLHPNGQVSYWSNTQDNFEEMWKVCAPPPGANRRFAVAAVKHVINDAISKGEEG